MKVEVAPQVVRFIANQAPEPRRALKLALGKLGSERGEIKPLEGQLEGYFRLRIRGFRIIFHYTKAAKVRRVIRCVFIERRSIIYAVFAAALKEQLLSHRDE